MRSGPSSESSSSSSPGRGSSLIAAPRSWVRAAESLEDTGLVERAHDLEPPPLQINPLLAVLFDDARGAVVAAVVVDLVQSSSRSLNRRARSAGETRTFPARSCCAKLVNAASIRNSVSRSFSARCCASAASACSTASARTRASLSFHCSSSAVLLDRPHTDLRTRLRRPGSCAPGRGVRRRNWNACSQSIDGRPRSDPAGRSRDSSELLVAVADHVAVGGVEFDRKTAAAKLLTRDQGRAGAGERVKHRVPAQARVREPGSPATHAANRAAPRLQADAAPV